MKSYCDLPFTVSLLASLLALTVSANGLDEGSIVEFGHSGEQEADVELESGNGGYQHGGLHAVKHGAGLGSLIGAKKEAPLSPGNLAKAVPSAPSAIAASSSRHQHQYNEGSSSSSSSVSSSSSSSNGELDKPYSGGLTYWVKLMLSPLEFVRAIASHFKLPFEGLVEKIGHGLVFGVEALLQPLVSTIKIAERLFVPDHCRLQFFCRLGSYMELFKEQMLKFSPGFLEGSLQVKALTSGISGKNCQVEYAQCEPRLKSSIEALRTSAGGEQAVGSELLGAPLGYN